MLLSPSSVVLFIPVFYFFPSLSPFPFLASWAVMSYPEIQSVVLDASFDDLLPLALKVMPDSWSKSTWLKVLNLLYYKLFWALFLET